MPKVTVSMNRHSVVDLALYGPQDRVEMMFRETARTVKRLRAGRGLGKIEPFAVPPPGDGSWPNLHDVVRWLDSLQRNKDFTGEVSFLRQLHNTCRRRVRPALLEELKA